MAKAAALNEEFLPALDSLLGRMIRRVAESSGACSSYEIPARRHAIILPEDGLSLLSGQRRLPNQWSAIFQMDDTTGVLPSFLTPWSS
jgi:hypothetical protein